MKSDQPYRLRGSIEPKRVIIRINAVFIEYPYTIAEWDDDDGDEADENEDEDGDDEEA